MRAAFLLSLLLLCGCSSSTPSNPASSSSSGGAGDAAADTSAPAPFAVQSSAFQDGDVLPKEHTCDGADTSPPLSWTPGPEGTKSYALVLNDTTIKFLHSVMYDIPVATSALPANVDKSYEPAAPQGAKQTKSYRPAVFGYAGPCPPSREDVYEFVLYALDVETLPNMTRDTTLKAAEAEIKKHTLGSVRITAKYRRP